jgi:hypothetical protein
MHFVSTPRAATPSRSRLPVTARCMAMTPRGCVAQAGAHMPQPARPRACSAATAVNFALSAVYIGSYIF